MAQRIAITNAQSAVPIRRQLMRDAARAVLAGEGVQDAIISLAFVDSPSIHRLNRQFLKHDEPTDVISFPLSPQGARPLQGELVICAEVAQSEAARRKHSSEAELTLYVIHGVLHLCGYDDLKPRDRRLMRDRERHYLRKLRLPEI